MKHTYKSKNIPKRASILILDHPANCKTSNNHILLHLTFVKKNPRHMALRHNPKGGDSKCGKLHMEYDLLGPNQSSCAILIFCIR